MSLPDKESHRNMKKIEAILVLLPPTNGNGLRRFLGILQYYRDVWEKRSDVLAPLTYLVGDECGMIKSTKAKGTKKLPSHWDLVHQAAFDSIKATIACGVVLAYPNFEEEFEIYADASTR